MEGEWKEVLAFRGEIYKYIYIVYILYMDVFVCLCESM